jgi:PAS domain S-box-containing protein
VRLSTAGDHVSKKSDEKPWYTDIDSFIDLVNCGVAARDRDMRIVYVNDRLLRWLGYERAEILGQESGMLFPANIRDLLLLEKDEIEAGDLRARLTVCQRKDGTGLPVLVLPQPFRDDAGDVIGGVSVIVDLSAIQMAKQAGYSAEGSVRSSLERIALEIQSIGLVADHPAATRAPLEHPELEGLSPREREILTQLLSAHRVPQIAESLHISPHTVRNHLKSIFEKVGVSSQAALIHKVRSLAE